MKLIDLNTIQEMWREDSKIDIDDLHNEALKIPQLHAKYYEIYSNLLILKKKYEEDRKKVKFERYEYYTGRAEPEIYVKDPSYKKVSDRSGGNKEYLTHTLNADEEVSKSTVKIEIVDVSLNYLLDVIKMIHNRSFQIKNSVDAMILIGEHKPDLKPK
jgi:hypothetical protein